MPPKQEQQKPISAAGVRRFCARWNNTFAHWNEGITSTSELAGRDPNFLSHEEYPSRWDQLMADVLEVGGSANATVSFAAAFGDRIKIMTDAAMKEEEGTCVQVRVSIEQDLTVTRTAFLGSLVVSNTGDSAMSNITVRLRIHRHDDATKTNVVDRFVIGDPDPMFTGTPSVTSQCSP